MLNVVPKLPRFGCCRLAWRGFSYKHDEASLLIGLWVISRKAPLLDRANHSQNRRPHVIRQALPGFDDKTQTIGNPMLCWYTFRVH